MLSHTIKRKKIVLGEIFKRNQFLSQVKSDITRICRGSHIIFWHNFLYNYQSIMMQASVVSWFEDWNNVYLFLWVGEKDFWHRNSPKIIFNWLNAKFKLFWVFFCCFSLPTRFSRSSHVNVNLLVLIYLLSTNNNNTVL